MSIVDKLRQVFQGKKSVVESVNNKAGSTLLDTCKWSELSETITNISTGANTTDATATSSDILKGKTAYGVEGKMEGTIETYNLEMSEGGSSEDYIEQLCNDTLTSYSNSNITSINKRYLFEKNTNLKTVDLGNVTSVGIYMFYNCGVTEVNLPKLASSSGYLFQYATKLTKVDVSSLLEVRAYDFNNCQSLQTLNLPKVISIAGVYAFMGCKVLTDIYIGGNKLVSLGNTNAFYDVTSGLKIHVRPEYADQYATATNWSSLIADGTIVIVGDYSD